MSKRCPYCGAPGTYGRMPRHRSDCALWKERLTEAAVAAAKIVEIGQEVAALVANAIAPQSVAPEAARDAVIQAARDVIETLSARKPRRAWTDEIHKLGEAVRAMATARDAAGGAPGRTR